MLRNSDRLTKLRERYLLRSFLGECSWMLMYAHDCSYALIAFGFWCEDFGKLKKRLSIQDWNQHNDASICEYVQRAASSAIHDKETKWNQHLHAFNISQCFLCSSHLCRTFCSNAWKSVITSSVSIPMDSKKLDNLTRATREEKTCHKVSQRFPPPRVTFLAAPSLNGDEAAAVSWTMKHDTLSLFLSPALTTQACKQRITLLPWIACCIQPIHLERDRDILERERLQ